MSVRLRFAIARLWCTVDHNDALVWSLLFLCGCYLFVRIGAGLL